MNRIESTVPDEPTAIVKQDRESEYSGPVTVTPLTFAGKTIRVVRPAEPDRMLDDPIVREWNLADDYMPYWAYLWPGSFLLAKVIASEPWPVASEGSRQKPLHALEIGCGVGLAGLTALACGLHVAFTDYDRAALHFVSRSARENGFPETSYTTGTLDWREPAGASYPLILGSDVLYERRLVPLVADLLMTRLTPGGQGWITCPGRTSAEGFVAQVESRGLHCQVKTVSSQSETNESIQGRLYQITKPPA